MKLNVWLQEMRSNFLTLSIVLAVYGVAIAYHVGAGQINWLYSIMACIGLVSLHISVNVFNEYFDFRDGIDLETPKTPFSGGSGVLPSQALKPQQVIWLAGVSLTIGALIGIYLAIQTGWTLAIIGLIGILTVVGYNTVLSKIMLGELAAGLGLGFLPVLGVQYVNTMQLSSEAIIAAVPAGFLVFNLLLLNEFPDAEADARGGRKHIVIMFGKKVSGFIYTFICLSVFIWIGGAVLTGMMPLWAIIGLLALPMGLRACVGALRDYNASLEKFLPAQAMNVVTTLVTQILLAIGFFLAPFTQS